MAERYLALGVADWPRALRRSGRTVGRRVLAPARFCLWYLARPRTLRAHLRDAALTLRRRGLSALISDIRAVGREIAQERASRRTARLLAAGAMADGRPGRSRGTILLVIHDMELGGAQEVARLTARWLRDRTQYTVRFVALRDGPFRSRFEEIAPTFCCLAWSGHSPAEAQAALKAFAGEDVVAILLNSVASGGFFDLWPEDTPSIAVIHEMPKLLDHFRPALDLILVRAHRVLGGSRKVAEVLAARYGADPAKLGHAYAFLDDRAAIRPESRAAARARLGVTEGEVLVCGSGVLHWRKSPEVFVAVAAQVLRAQPEVRFLWIGGGPDQAATEALIARQGLSDRIRVTGYVPDIDADLHAGDIFLLPSEEDPFPLAALHAARLGQPVICFEDAGGMPEFTALGAGVAVPFGDVAAMADAVIARARDPARRAAEGEAGRAAVARSFTIGRVGPLLLGEIRAVAGLKPAVSVVVPNYNYARFLPERLTSILNQTLQDFELILLDDASTDASVPILTEAAGFWPATRLVVNDTNTGSPFAQWLRGMALATSDLVWIAEADDACDPDFLENLLPAFDDPAVFLGHGQSVPVDADGAILGDYAALYLDRIAPGRWSAPFTAWDHEEANAGLGIANAIPNASAVVFRNFQPEPELARDLCAMRLCGDWLFYLRALRGGRIAYRPGARNLHRRHSLTVTHRLEGTALYFDELAAVRRFIGATWTLSEAAQTRAAGFSEAEVARFPQAPPEAVAGLRAALVPGQKPMPTLLMVVSDLAPGGGQLFGIRMANAWMRRGGRVLLHNAAAYPDHPKVRAKVDPRVAVVARGEPGSGLADLVTGFDVDVIHSSIWWADRHVLSQIRTLPRRPPWVITMHGCHETLIDMPTVEPDFPRILGEMLVEADAFAYTAEKNRRAFRDIGRPRRLVRQVNGIDREPGRPVSRSQLGLRDGALLVCLAARAIPDKGWREAVRVIAAVNRAGLAADLLLIGEGPRAEMVQREAPKHVRILGQVANLQDYLAAADIGLIASRFRGESLPLVALEMMACGLPIIASDAGELPALIGGEDPAGLIVPLINGAFDRDGFVDAVLALADPDSRARLGASGAARFAARYTTALMADAYRDLYADVGAGRR